MPFKNLLSRLLEDIPGAVGAIIIDWEGEAVDQVTRIDEYDIKVLGAHSGIILGMMRDALSRVEGGELNEVVICTEQNKIMMVPLTDEYLLILQLKQSAITARAAYKMRLCVDELREDFDF
jgi:predicted regulator of Ras-like GTPase activity (Roadblock/LC7/MglB family)